MDGADVLQMYTPAIGIILPLVFAVRIYWFSFIDADIAYGWKWTKKRNRWLVPTKGLATVGHPVQAFLIRHSLMLCAHIAVLLVVGTIISLFTGWSWWAWTMFPAVTAIFLGSYIHHLCWAQISKKWLRQPLPILLSRVKLKETGLELESSVEWFGWMFDSWLADYAAHPSGFPEEQVEVVMRSVVKRYDSTQNSGARRRFVEKVLEDLAVLARARNLTYSAGKTSAQRAVGLVPDRWLEENIWHDDLIHFLPLLKVRKNGWKIALNSAHATDRFNERSSVLDAHHEAVTSWLAEAHPSLTGIPSEWLLEALDGERVQSTPEEDVWGSHVPEAGTADERSEQNAK